MKKKPTSTKPKRATKKKAGGSCPSASCSPDFTVDGTPVVDLDTNMEQCAYGFCEDCDQERIFILN